MKWTHSLWMTLALCLALPAQAQDAASILGQRETDLSQLTEDVARLAARHQSAERLLDDA